MCQRRQTETGLSVLYGVLFRIGDGRYLPITPGTTAGFHMLWYFRILVYLRSINVKTCEYSLFTLELCRAGKEDSFLPPGRDFNEHEIYDLIHSSELAKYGGSTLILQSSFHIRLVGMTASTQALITIRSASSPDLSLDDCLYFGEEFNSRSYLPQCIQKKIGQAIWTFSLKFL
jgi:hypothetical protein